MKKSKNKVIFETSAGREITITFKFPKENPPGAYESFCDALRYVGVLDDWKSICLISRNLYNITRRSNKINKYIRSGIY